jgi:hypothetical protein
MNSAVPENNDWLERRSSSPRAIYSYNKAFPVPGDAIDVLVLIYERGGQYEIWTSAEARISGPVDTLIGKTASLEEALVIAQAACRRWDNRI